MPKIMVDVGHTKYPLYIERGGLKNCGAYIKEAYPKARAVIVSDENVYPLYGEAVLQSLRGAGMDAKAIVMPPGEKTKSHEALISVYNKLIDLGVQKSDVIVSLGGGVIGDLAGFAAATYLRGVGFVQIPTTLLAQVDSSIGGKVAVNLESGKNMVGAFYHPALVVIDADVLATLTDDDYAGGMAEAIKTGAIYDADLFEMIEQNAGRERSEQVIDKIVAGCCKIKADVVREDELDNGLRMILNFGHTLGHALEKIPGNALTHGQAVSVGMASFALLGEKLGLTDDGTADKIKAVSEAFGLPTEMSGDRQKIIEIMKRDKKIRGGELNVVLLKHIGEAVIHKVPVDKIGELI